MTKPLTPHDNEGIVAYDQDGYISEQTGTTVPTDATAGYSHGCIFKDTNGTTGADALYYNTGTNASCAFRSVVQQDSTGAVAFTGAVTTTDGVASGTARKVGGGAFAQVAASTAQTGADETDVAFDQTYTMPANTLKPGTRIRVRAQGIHTATTGSETHTIALKLGGVTIVSKAAVDPANNDLFYIDAEIVCRTDGASGTLVAAGAIAVGASGTGALVAFLKASTAIDTTAANIIGVYIDRQGTATDSDSARLDLLTVDVIG